MIALIRRGGGRHWPILVPMFIVVPIFGAFLSRADQGIEEQVKTPVSLAIPADIPSPLEKFIGDGCNTVSSDERFALTAGIESGNLESIFLADACVMENFIEADQLDFTRTPLIGGDRPVLRKYIKEAYAPVDRLSPDKVVFFFGHDVLKGAKQPGAVENSLGSEFSRSVLAFWRALSDPMHNDADFCWRVGISTIPLKERYARLYLYYKVLDLKSEIELVRSNPTLTRLLVRAVNDRQTTSGQLSEGGDSDAPFPQQIDQPATLRSCQLLLMDVVQQSAADGDPWAIVGMNAIAMRARDSCGATKSSDGSAKTSTCIMLRNFIVRASQESITQATSHVLEVTNAILDGSCSSLTCALGDQWRPAR